MILDMLAMEKRNAGSWSNTPIPQFILSASGILALADLSTIAERTALTGTATYLDVFVLAPGLHFQQRADRPSRSRPQQAFSLATEDVVLLNNRATERWLERSGKHRQMVTIDVRRKGSKNRRRVSGGTRHEILGPESEHGSKLSSMLYYSCVASTVISGLFMILSADWWALGLMSMLMLARALNIWVIRERDKDDRLPKRTREWSYLGIDLEEDRGICLRGLRSDLDAITTQRWLRGMTSLESYFEAIGKMLVYLAAALSGNMTQAGDIILVVLLLSSAALLGLSNKFNSKLQVNGREAIISHSGPLDRQQLACEETVTETDSDGRTVNYEKRLEEVETTYPFDEGVEYY